ncbi:spermatogenesis-associated protein 17 isoform X1 [Polypterus senegalus]|uniref:spermatogenesis-associated protein 17 isoform X1 n=2 Tax=Polypterus senegalus TaxID=55291 RepID=UPI00196481E0|nr:spermatogenesis-associated protein 17 isoform X1 [Polypterus senegalus]
MATLEKLLRRVEDIHEEYFRRNRIAEEDRAKEVKAAIMIQAWYRGCRVRGYLRYLNRMAIIIQKNWRGYLGRKYFRKMMKTEYFVVKMNFYNEMAVRIQKRWRSYYVRKYIHNYYAIKSYLEGLTVKNAIIREKLNEYVETTLKRQEEMALDNEERRKDYQAQRTHYLISTELRPGVFNSPFRLFPDEMEFRLQRCRPQIHSALPVCETDHTTRASGSAASFTSASMQRLPPISKKKLQGPFRDPAEVLQQRLKPLEPTLRVATSITSMEEARKELKREEERGRVNNKLFYPFSKADNNTKYEPSIHSSGSPELIAYGSKHFRDENLELLQGKKAFKTVFTPIQLFDKYGKTYSSNGNVV